MGCSSFGLSALFCPVGTFCPATMYKHYGLKLTKDSVQANTAQNDFCCHVATSLKTVPLDKIQDVELTTNCIHTCFGLQQLNVQTAGQSGAVGAEVMAPYLDNPAQVRAEQQEICALQPSPLTNISSSVVQSSSQVAVCAMCWSGGSTAWHGLHGKSSCTGLVAAPRQL